MDIGNRRSLLAQFIWRVSTCHILSYFILGITFSTLLNYEDAYTNTILSTFMRPFSSPWVAAGPSLQIVRGILFALVLWPIKDVFLKRDNGWLILWILFIGLAVLGPVGPAPGSLEGMIYTKLPMSYHLFGLPEVVFQTLLFSLSLYYWYKSPGRLWNIIMSVSIVLIILMSLAGIFWR